MLLDAALFWDVFTASCQNAASKLVAAGWLQVPHVAQSGVAQQSSPKLETAKLFMPILNSLSLSPS